MRGHLTKLVSAVLLCLAVAAPAAAGGATVDRIENFGSVVAVRFEADFPLRSLMRADCAFVQRVERPDGSARELLSCVLSDEPVMIPEFQGVPPTSALTFSTGPCLWISDYQALAADEIEYAENAHLVVTPSGQVRATSTYPAEPLAC